MKQFMENSMSSTMNKNQSNESLNSKNVKHFAVGTYGGIIEAKPDQIQKQKTLKKLETNLNDFDDEETQERDVFTEEYLKCLNTNIMDQEHQDHKKYFTKSKNQED